MEIKKYSSFDEIEIELKILKLEKEISFQKLIWNIQKIKENDMDVAFISAIPLPLEVNNLADFSFFTNENPILDWPQHSMYDWSKHFVNSKLIEIWNTYPDYGWAGLTHVKRLG